MRRTAWIAESPAVARPSRSARTWEGGARFDLRVCHDIREIDPAEWDSLLSTDDLQASHRFHLVCRDSGVEGARYRHLLLYRGGVLQAVATLSRIDVALELLASAPVRSVVRSLRRFSPNLLRIPVLFCGLPVSFGQSALRIRHGAEVAAIVRLVADEMEQIAAEEETPVLCFKELAAEERVALGELRSRGYFRAPSLDYCALDLRWGSFSEYLEDLRAGYRRQVRILGRARDALGLDVRLLESVAGMSADLYPLYEQVIDRAEHRLERLPVEFFDHLARYFESETSAILVEKDGVLLAWAILLQGPSVTTFLLTGLDYEANRRYPVYPVLVTEVLAHAIGRGARRLEMGQTAYAIKSRLGAELSPRDLYIRCRKRALHALMASASGLLFPPAEHRKRRVFRR